MRRREFIALAVAGVAWPFPAMAQQPGRTYHIGCLFAGRVPELWDAFFDPARRHGFIEGQNLVIELREYAQHIDLLPEWADKMSKSGVDVIAVAGDPAIRAAQKATNTIPVLTITDDMVGAGLVNSMARPDGNRD
jgi:putative ABC transport system substrate-binding protein